MDPSFEGANDIAIYASAYRIVGDSSGQVIGKIRSDTGQHSVTIPSSYIQDNTTYIRLKGVGTGASKIDGVYII